MSTIYKIPNQSFEELLKNISNAIGVSIDNSSFDYDILKAFHSYNTLMNENIETKLNGLLYENMTGADLDDFLAFYNIYRIQGNNQDIYEIEVIFSSEDTLLIQDKCLIEIDGILYETVGDHQISNTKDKIILQRSNQTSIEEQLITKDYKMILDQHKVSLSSDKNIHKSIQKLYLISFQRISNEKESDFEFLSRSKSILQNYGYSNKTKIKNELLADSRIKNVHIEEDDGVSYVIVYPKKTSELNEIIESAKHVVNYFKDSNIQLVKPNIIEINVFGLKNQISFLFNKDEIEAKVISNIRSILNNSYIENDELKISKNTFINSIAEVVEQFHLDINLSLIGINYNYYYRGNYVTPIYNADIENELVVHYYDVVTEGSVI